MASSIQELYTPRDPEDADFGVLGGVQRNKPSTRLEQGKFLVAEGVIADGSGLKRRNGSVPFAGGSTVSYAPLRDIFTFFNATANQRIGVLDRKFVYKVSGANFVRQLYAHSAGMARASGAFIVRATGTLTNWGAANEIRAGDAFVFKPGTASEAEYLISVVNGTNLLTPTTTPAAYTTSAYAIHRAFGYSTQNFVDWCLCDNVLVFADFTRPIYQWDGSAVSAFDASNTFVPKCLAYFGDRLFAGHIIDGASTYRSRIMWSKILDHTDFGTAQWLDLPYSPGELLRLVPMGRLLLAYFTDAIYIGRPTNIAGDTLPVSFERLATGGSGLAGMKAVAPFYDGHFLLLDDGPYFLDNNGLSFIGNAVWPQMKDESATWRRTFVVVDWEQECAIYAVPDAVEGLAKLWYYNYKSKEWTSSVLPCTMLGSIFQNTGQSWDDTVGTWNAQTSNWDDFAANFKKYTVLGRAGAAALFDSGATTDYDGSPIQTVLETGDLQYGAPNDEKVALGMSIKLNVLASATVTYTVEGSTNRGLTWKSLGSIVIPANEDESDIGFKLRGSMHRFRITASAGIPPYRVVEWVLRVRIAGKELRFGPND